MDAGDLTVEVRDKTLARVGVIPPADVNIKLSPVLNGLSTWSLSLPADHPMADVLSTPGSGIIVTGPHDVIMSGPVTAIDKIISVTYPAGALNISGVDDSVILKDTLSFPQPTNPDATTQNVAWDVRTGVAETLMRQYVSANCGPTAPSPRRRTALTLAADQGRGPTMTKSPRFPYLGDLLTEIAMVANLTFRIVQRGSNLVFEVGNRTDRSSLVRFDIYNGNLTSQETTIGPPMATTVIVAGQGDLTERQFIVRTNSTAQTDSATWGRYIEVWVDQRNTGVIAELQQSGDEVLAGSGFTQVTTKIVPADTIGMEYGVDWNLGDTVSIAVDGVEQRSYVSGCNIISDKDGTRVGVLLGDQAQMDAVVAQQAQADDLETRVQYLEKNTGAYTGTGWTNAAYLNSWADFGSPRQSMRYRRTTTNQVEIQGTCKGASGTVVFQLPVGYRPNYTVAIPITAGGAFGYIDVDSNGNVTAYGTTGTSANIQATFGL